METISIVSFVFKYNCYDKIWHGNQNILVTSRFIIKHRSTDLRIMQKEDRAFWQKTKYIYSEFQSKNKNQSKFIIKMFRFHFFGWKRGEKAKGHERQIVENFEKFNFHQIGHILKLNESGRYLDVIFSSKLDDWIVTKA